MSLTIPPLKVPDKVQKLEGVYAVGRAAYSVYKILTKRPPEVVTQKTPWRPPQWKGSAQAAQVSIAEDNGKIHVFDAVFRTDHTTSMRVTEHPVQTGASIVDHSYALPEKLTLEIGMSDVMDSYVPGSWQEYSKKSIAAYQKLKELQYSRKPLTVTTRLNVYNNMVIEYISSADNNQTINGLKCSVSFRQLFTSEVKVVKVSARKQVTQKTPMGTKQAKPSYEVPTLARKIEQVLGVK